MKAACPKDASHKEFVTTVRVDVDWVVDAEGRLVETLDLVDIVRGPSTERGWECAVCHEDAVVTD